MNGNVPTTSMASKAYLLKPNQGPQRILYTRCRMIWQPGDSYKVILFYKYFPLSPDTVDMLVEDFTSFCAYCNILGRLLLSTEGVNGTLAGSAEAIDSFICRFELVLDVGPIDWKFSYGEGENLPFLALSVRNVKELIAPGKQRSFISQHIAYDKSCFGGISGTGKHLSPEEFHSGIQNRNAIVLDVRNEFEYDIGHFENAANLKTFNYAETWTSLDKTLASIEPLSERDDSTVSDDSKMRPIYMYCTGGIRCEKASAYLVAKGYSNVHQLQGGIHRYLEAYPNGGLFKGKNFVFDSRVSVPAKATDNELISDSNSSVEVKDVIGKCIDCEIPFDVFSGNNVCTVCRMPVLVCNTCKNNNPYPEEFYCSRHRAFKNIYFTVLERFSVEELKHQITNLEAIHKSMNLHKDKRRRKTITKQISKIQQIILKKEEILSSISGAPSDDSEKESREIPPSEQLKNPKTRGGWGFWRA